jgi:hypothetical protein
MAPNDSLWLSLYPYGSLLTHNGFIRVPFGSLWPTMTFVDFGTTT